jgi:LysR family nitrogen assimilation transcriptional regulator
MTDVRRDLTLHQMRLFVELVSAGSFTRAAVSTDVTQSALSRMVRHMETTLDARLFDRSGRGISLSEDGKVLYAAVVDILGRYDTAVEEIRSTSGVLHGECRVVMPESAGRILFLPLIQDMRRRHPKCSVRVSAAVSASVPTMLQTRQADIAVVMDTHSHIGLEVWPIARESFYLVGLPGTMHVKIAEVSLRRLAGLPLLLPAAPNGIRRRINEAFAVAGVTVDVRQEIDVTEALIDMIQSGEGYSIMPFSSVHREVMDGRLAASLITQPEISRSIFGALPERGPASPVVREVARSLLPIARRHGATAKWSTA